MDKVTLPIVIGLDETWYTKVRHRPLCFPQKGSGSDLFCSIKIYFCQRITQTNITFIFWGRGRGIAYYY